MQKDAVNRVLEETKEKAEPLVRCAKDMAKTVAQRAEAAVEPAERSLAQAEEPVPEVYVQFSSRQFDCAELVRRCEADFRTKHKNANVRSCKLYIKPEDNTVYYVINDIQDRLPL